MPQISTAYLLFGAAFALSSRLAPRALWPWLRDLVGIAFLVWWDPNSLLMLGCLTGGAWLGSRLQRRLPALSWLFLGLMTAAFVAVRIAQRGQAVDHILAPQASASQCCASSTGGSSGRGSLCPSTDPVSSSRG